MIILGLGIDIVDLNRFDKINKIKLFKRLANCNIPDTINVAKNFSVKESIVKCLGTGFIKKLSFKNIIIYNNKLGKPKLFIEKIKNFKILISISHEKQFLISFSILYI